MLCAFVRHPTEDPVFSDKHTTDAPNPLIRPDVGAAYGSEFVNRDQRRLDIESEASFTVDLQYCQAQGRGLRACTTVQGQSPSSGIIVEGETLQCEYDRLGPHVRKPVVKPNCWNGNLSYADIDNAKLPNARLVRTVMTGANLKGANLADAELGLADLTDADLHGARLPRATLIDAKAAQSQAV